MYIYVYLHIYICMPGGPIRAWPMRAQGRTQGPSPQGPSPQGPGGPHKGPGGPARLVPEDTDFQEPAVGGHPLGVHRALL